MYRAVVIGLLAVFFLVGDPVASQLQHCGIEHACAIFSPEEAFQANHYFPPNKEQLKILCPLTIQYMECINDQTKICIGKDLMELAAMDNSSISEFAGTLVNFARLLDDLCDESTDLHKNYVENVVCFNDMIQKRDDSCRKEAMEAYEGFQDTLNLLEVDDEVVTEQKKCIVVAYTIACFSLQVQEQCSEEARATFVGIIKRLKVLREGCSMEHILVLKNEFMDYLVFENGQRSFFYDVFDAKRK